MTETYTSGLWTVKAGEETDFVDAWREFVAWAGEMPGSNTFRLVRDLDRPNRFLSFAPWDSFEAQDAWKHRPEFSDRIGQVRRHCEEFQPFTYELVTEVG
jgi:heme-degrading monooxygenase HmoA